MPDVERNSGEIRAGGAHEVLRRREPGVFDVLPGRPAKPPFEASHERGAAQAAPAAEPRHVQLRLEKVGVDAGQFGAEVFGGFGREGGGEPVAELLQFLR